MKVEVETITPEIAAAALASNGHNRSVSENRVSQLAGAMARGEFIGLNGETIKFDDDGNLIDGQHRYHAIVRSGTTHRLLIAHGVPEGSQETIDIGRARTFSDVLMIRGERYPTQLAAAVGSLAAYERIHIPLLPMLQVQPTHQEKLVVLERHPAIRESLHAGGHSRGMLVLSRSEVMVLHYLFASVDRDDADEFFVLLAAGEGLTAGSAIFALRDRFIREMSGPTRLRNVVKLAFTVRAFNAWRGGETLLKLQWKAGGSHPDNFP
jgi:hypothetical protein